MEDASLVKEPPNSPPLSLSLTFLDAIGSPEEQEDKLKSEEISYRCVGYGGGDAPCSSDLQQKRTFDIDVSSPSPNKNQFRPFSFSTPVKNYETVENYDRNTSSSSTYESINCSQVEDDNNRTMLSFSEKDKRVSLHLTRENKVDSNCSGICQPIFSSSLLFDNNEDQPEEHNNSTLDLLESSKLQTTLNEVLLENSSLKQELNTKSRQLKTVKLQMQALLDLDTSTLDLPPNTSVLNTQTLRIFEDPAPENSGISKINTTMTNIGLNISKNNNVIQNTGNNELIPDQNQNDYPIPLRILPEHTFILIREITSRIEVHQVRERMIVGLQISNQFILGGTAGWVAAYLVKNFGKTALTAVGGGCILLGFANKQGFVEVNWNRVLVELQRRGEAREQMSRSRLSTTTQDDCSDVPDEGDDDLSVGEDWTVSKIQAAKKWICDHSIAVAGFTCGFFYSVM